MDAATNSSGYICVYRHVEEGGSACGSAGALLQVRLEPLYEHRGNAGLACASVSGEAFVNPHGDREAQEASR